MKKLKVLAAITLLCVISVVSYLAGKYQHQCDYEAACLQADFIHQLMDDEDYGSEVEELYYEWFQDLDMGVYNTKYLTLSKLEYYSWCY